MNFVAYHTTMAIIIMACWLSSLSVRLLLGWSGGTHGNHPAAATFSSSAPSSPPSRRFISLVGEFIKKPEACEAVVVVVVPGRIIFHVAG